MLKTIFLLSSALLISASSQAMEASSSISTEIQGSQTSQTKKTYIFSRDPSKKPDHKLDKLLGLQKQIAEQVKNNQFDQAHSSLAECVEVMKVSPSDYFLQFIKQAEASTRNEEVYFNKKTVEQQSLGAWPLLFVELRRRDCQKFDELIKKSTESYLQSNAPFIHRLDVLNFIYKPSGGGFFNKNSNSYFLPKLAQTQFDLLLKSTTLNSESYAEATLFVLQALSSSNLEASRDNHDLHSESEPLEKKLLAHLAEIGSYWHKILYAVHYTGGYRYEPIFGELIGTERVKKTLRDIQKNNPEYLFFLAQQLEKESGKDFSTNPEEILKDQ